MTIDFAALVASGQTRSDALPCPELQAILLPAYEPCATLLAGGACYERARFEPNAGYIPRGFVGAFASAADVKLVLVTAEPGDPLPDEGYSHDARPIDLLEQACRLTYGSLKLAPEVHDRNFRFHKNIRRILDLCWPMIAGDLDRQLERTWIVDSYLCSAVVESGPVDRAAWKACGLTYLRPQLDLFSEATIAALGGKAFERVSRYRADALRAFAAAPPGSDRKAAPASWQAVANKLRAASD